ncbi:AraC family transcriptional regulator ligand-binding domain-containing protein [Eudoraea sp.]|uniref:AraC family transcriptional regulator n=1 Tax=Eudoraea sp. TaxID=1979955 RepID=UPI003C73DD33
MHYISINLYRKVINHALSEGLERGFLENLPTSIDEISHLNAVPADHFFELHELLDNALGPGFSARVGQQMKIDDYGVLGLAWKTCSWVGEIFDRSERYFKLLSDSYVFKVEKHSDISKIYLLRDAHRRGLELSNEATFAATVVVLQAISDKEIFPTLVSFKHDEPKQLDSYKRAFQCPILFNQPHNFIYYRAEDLNARTAKADISINKFLLERVKEETKGIEIGANRIVTDTERLIKDALPSGIPSITSISEILGMSNRTLTRRLSENGLTFRDLIQKKQEEVSKYLLKKSNPNLVEITFETGFSEQSAFNRAFKRWTGKTPVEYMNS